MTPPGPASSDQVDVGRQLLVQPVDERLGLGLGVELVALGDAGADADVALGALAPTLAPISPSSVEVDPVRAVGELDDPAAPSTPRWTQAMFSSPFELVLGAS